ncbi:hypothetical protein [Archangium lansingense]|uniref:Uncharacterized protein n=1 Tax=Archangium lansingense TaxID=2995310 RepID=A0ABT4AP02_9BACT|nr:hypothetical protein [Archangium lansinium]MCY1083420.1 hypothetical protein [Archangium lansinium]
MNGNKQLKFAIRERMKRTGESYSTARMHVLWKRSPSERTFAKRQVDLERLGTTLRSLPDFKSQLEPLLSAWTRGLRESLKVEMRFPVVAISQEWTDSISAIPKDVTESLIADALTPAIQISESISAMHQRWSEDLSHSITAVAKNVTEGVAQAAAQISETLRTTTQHYMELRSQLADALEPRAQESAQVSEILLAMSRNSRR